VVVDAAAAEDLDVGRSFLLEVVAEVEAGRVWGRSQLEVVGEQSEGQIAAALEDRLGNLGEVLPRVCGEEERLKLG
jgi:hypothetical protein